MTQTNFIPLYYCSGQVGDYVELFEKLKLDAGQINWSWYEPVPESLTKKEKLNKLLIKGMPEITAGIEYSEMMLFMNVGGIVLSEQAEGYRYFYFSEQAINTTDNVQSGEQHCIKMPEVPVMLRDEETLKKQYNLNIPDQLSNNYPDSLQLTQYMHDNLCIAWTLTDKEENND